MKQQPKARTWWIAASVFLVALSFSATCQLRDYAHLKASLSEHFILQNEETDYSIAILKDLRLFRIYCAYQVVYLAMIPVILHKFRWRCRWNLLLLVLLFLPSVWYSNQIAQVAMKIVDWNAFLP